MPIVGANWNNTSNAGSSALNFNNPRTNANHNIGFFSAYPFIENTSSTRRRAVKAKGKGLISSTGHGRRKLNNPEETFPGKTNLSGAKGGFFFQGNPPFLYTVSSASKGVPVGQGRGGRKSPRESF
ncbi:hypothetical protein NXH76_12150 [Blautia schinkii]|nr:hypothetical protein [Blautia schinkii]